MKSNSNKEKVKLENRERLKSAIEYLNNNCNLSIRFVANVNMLHYIKKSNGKLGRFVVDQHYLQ